MKASQLDLQTVIASIARHPRLQSASRQVVNGSYYHYVNGVFNKHTVYPNKSILSVGPLSVERLSVWSLSAERLSLITYQSRGYQVEIFFKSEFTNDENHEI